MLAQAALAYARFVDEEKRAEEVDGVLDLKPKRERKQSGKITRWTEAEEAPLALKPHAPRLLAPLGALLAAAMAVTDAQMADEPDALDDGGGVCDSDGGMLGLPALLST